MVLVLRRVNIMSRTAPFLRVDVTNIRSKTIGAATKLGNERRTRVLNRKMTGFTPAWKRHLIREHRVATLRMKTPSKTTKSPTAHLRPEQNNASPECREHINFGSMPDQIKSFAIGSFAGLLGSLAGMGGGFVMIPLMTAARNGIVRGGLGLSQHQAHGTSLFAVGTTGLAGALGYGISTGNGDDIVTSEGKSNQQPGFVELDTAVALATTAMVTARLGAISSSYLSEHVLKKCLGAFMICVAPLVPGKAYLEALHDSFDPTNADSQKHIEKDQAEHLQHNNLSQIERLLPASVIGLFSGFLSGMFGVGGGAIVVPALVLTTDMSHHSALGTSLCAMVLPAMIGTYTHAKRGNVNWRFGPLLAIGSSCGAYFGGREVSIHLEEDVLRGGFACLMLFLGIRTWRK